MLTPLRGFLRRGGVIAYATESCFGLGCDPRNARAVQRLLRIKSRPQRKGLILIAADLAQLRPYLAPLSVAERALLDDYWPGPTTVLLPASRRCPRWLTGAHTKIAVRITAHPDARRACLAAGMALVSTSANRTGQVSLKTVARCQAVFGDAVRTLPGRVGPRKRPSTLIDLATQRVLRA
ncbi:MAG: Sua5/YciO/YrdC/YwlC family protein [Betaproteobacteria bacterium]|nr:MAG: Sua5/YciO/YrdC/YwlC family protein [Betaproteobacteria bacterium]